MLKVGDFVYIPPFDNSHIVYDKDRPSYEIKEIKSRIGGVKSYHFVEDDYEEKIYLLDINNEIKPFDFVKSIPNIKINSIDISNFKINGHNITKIETDMGEWNFVEGKGYQPTYPNRYKYTLSDNSIVLSDEYNITNEVINGGRRTRRKTKKYKKSKKLRRKSNRRRR
jgi:hypothetical protein